MSAADNENSDETGQRSENSATAEADMETSPETALAETLEKGGEGPGEATDPITQKLHQAVDLHRNGLFVDAADMYGQILLEDPENANALYLLGMILHRMNENEKAVELVSQAIALELENAGAYGNLGIIYRALGNLEDASLCQQKAVTLDPDYTAGYFNLGNALHEFGKSADAAASYRKAISLKPDFPEAHNNLGLALHEAELFEEALESYEKALGVKPNYPAAYLNMGNALRKLGRSDAAAVSFQKAIVLKPELTQAHNNLGNVLMDLDHFEGAAVSYSNAIRHDPDNIGAHKNLGIINLLLGNFDIGWPEYSWRLLEENSVLKTRVYSQAQWDGADLTGKTIFVYSEQGLGDTIQFARYLPMLQERGGRVMFDAPPHMTRLFEDLDGVDVMVKGNDSIPPFDCHAPLLELPGLFNTSLDTIPVSEAYLSADKDLVDAWGQRLGVRQGYRIGLVWAGNPSHLNDVNRSIQPELFCPLTEAPGVSAYSLMVGRDGEAGRVSGDAITDLAEGLVDFAETAAVIANMDLIISVDTAVVHLAGALGVPIWTLLPFNPDWRWMLDRDDSPWYPSMRLFRQEKRKDWESVLERVANELAERVRDADNSEGDEG